MITRACALLLVPVVLAACGREPVSYSAPVGLNLKAKGDDVKNNVVVDEKSITTESGNPYGAFVSEARRRLGRDPGQIDVRAATLLLGGTSKGVTALEQALAGRVDVQFVMNDSNNTFNVAHVTDPKGVGPVRLSVGFEPRMIQGEDYGRLLNGSFKVVLRSAAAAGFAGRKDTQADLQVTLEFAAFE